MRVQDISGALQNLLFALSNRLQTPCNSNVSICGLNLVSPTITFRDVHASIHWVSTPNSAIGDQLAPEHKQTLHQGSLAPGKDNNAACNSMNTSLALKTRAAQSHTSTSPHTVHLFCTIFTPFLTPCYPSGATFTPFLPRFSPTVQLLPHFYSTFTLFLPPYAHCNTDFTPNLPLYYPNGVAFTPLLPLQEGKNPMFTPILP